jgi:NADPH:quinone reductase-like Zn-dependent oxidoreductase
LLDRSVLLTGATGGVGYLACQLAHHAGAHVTAVVRREEHVTLLREAGAHQVLLSADNALQTPATRPFDKLFSANPLAASADGRGASGSGPYDLIVDSVGGPTLANALGLIAPGGTCVVLGTTDGATLTFDLGCFYLTGGATLYGFFLIHELRRRPAAEGLGRLARLVAEGKLRPLIALEVPWQQVAEAAQQLLERRFPGKAVLHVE